jgi:hypothetical protein
MYAGSDPDNTNYVSLEAAATYVGIIGNKNGSGTVQELRVKSNGANIVLDPGSADIKWNKALVALGGGAVPTLGTIGGAGPTGAAQVGWERRLDSTGAVCWSPIWK